MSFWESIYNNGFEAIGALLIANISAQLFKTIRVGFQKKRFNFNIFFATGGMPSSHTSTIIAMSTSVGLVDGFSSTSFAIAITFASIVMFDAAGVRQAASRQARVLNKIVKEMLSEDNALRKNRLKEFLGHTPLEVWAGAGLGVACSLLFRYFLEYQLGIV